MRPTQPPTRLNTSIPFRSSHLAIPPTPFSPQSAIPIAPTMPPRTHSTSTTSSNTHPPPPTRAPMNWLWACHICHRTYRLGVTRRCLDDGHNFCSGTTTLTRRDGTKRIKRHPACASEFDYAGWKTWGVWRRSVTSPCTSVFEEDSEDEDVQEITHSVVSPLTPGKPASWFRDTGVEKKDCWNSCDYPSQCRWGKQFGVDTPVVATFPVSQRGTSISKDTEMTDASAPPATDFETILGTEQKVVAETVDGVEDTAAAPGLQDLADLVTRARRRNSKSEIEHSPLAVDTLVPAVASASHSAAEDGDGDGEKRHVRQSGSRDTLRKAYEGLDLEVRKGFGALASILRGGSTVWRPETSQEQESKLRRRSSVG